MARKNQGHACRLGFELRPYFDGWISRRTWYPLGHLNIPALRGVKKRSLYLYYIYSSFSGLRLIIWASL